MTDSDGNLRISLRKYMERNPINGFTWVDKPGAERLRVAVENAIAQERPNHHVYPWGSGDMKCVRAVYDRAKEQMAKYPQALGKIANVRGYHYDSEPQHIPQNTYKSRFSSPPVNERDEWEKSKYEDLPNVGNQYTMEKHAAVRSRYADVGEPPRKSNGEIDYDKLSEMTGHKPYKGPGAAGSPRILSQPDHPYKSRL